MANESQDGKLRTTASTCENCGAAPLTKFIDRPRHQLLHCDRCNLFQQGILESTEVYEGDYHDCYSVRRKSKMLTAAIRLASITKHLNTRHPKMLDIGCSVGATVAAAKQLGWEAVGVDISQQAIDICLADGLECQTIDKVQLPFADGEFDVITNWHVIEHCQDVRETLAEWYRVLKPGGVMILETPDSTCAKAKKLGASYAKFWPPEHLYTFDRNNLASFLNRAGFEILPTKLIGRRDALPIHRQAYALLYRGFRETWRQLGYCKSLEITCRKPTTAPSAQSKSAAA